MAGEAGRSDPLAGGAWGWNRVLPATAMLTLDR